MKKGGGTGRRTNYRGGGGSDGSSSGLWGDGEGVLTAQAMRVKESDSKVEW